MLPVRTVVIIGGGPTGLYYGILHKKNYPDERVVVLERNASDSTFGWGVVFSDATMENIKAADTQSAAAIDNEINHWDDIEMFFKNVSQKSTGHGFIGIERLRLLTILQERCKQLGVELLFNTEIEDEMVIADQYRADLIIASDGIHSRIRQKYTTEFAVDVAKGKCRFVWLGTKKLFNAFTFIFEKTQYGWVAVHAYRFNHDTSTFIVEMREEVWVKAGLDKMTQEQSLSWCEKVFAKYLEGNALLSNARHLRGSTNWIVFPRIICGKWHTWQKTQEGRVVPIVLMGDSSHTAHFSIGSGTKLGFEDAIAFNNLLQKIDNIHFAIEEYERIRGIEVAKLQGAAKNSTWWFEHIHLHDHLPAEQFYYSLLTRSLRITHDNLTMRDAGYIAHYEKHCCDGKSPRNLPWKLKGHASMLELSNRCLLEMRGANTDEKLKDTVKKYTPSLIISASFNSVGDEGEFKNTVRHFIQQCQDVKVRCAISLGYTTDNSEDAQTFNTKTLDTIKEAVTHNAVEAQTLGADALEFNIADGNVFNKLVSPLTDHRKRKTGNDVISRCNYVLDVFHAVKTHVHIPVMVRINVCDYHVDGNHIADGIAMAQLFARHGTASINVTSGGVLADTNVHKGRVYNGLFADTVRNKLLTSGLSDTATVCTGCINSVHQIDMLVASARSDLVAIDGLQIAVDNSLPNPS